MIHLYLGIPSFKFKSQYPNIPVIRVSNRDEIEDFIVMYGDVQVKQSIAVEDISLLSYQHQTFLLKFIESTEMNVALLARFDRILPTIVSRADRVFKQLPDMKKQMLPMEEAFAHFEMTQNKNEQWKNVSEENPRLWYLMHKYPRLKGKHLQFFV